MDIRLLATFRDSFIKLIESHQRFSMNLDKQIEIDKPFGDIRFKYLKCLASLKISGEYSKSIPIQISDYLDVDSLKNVFISIRNNYDAVPNIVKEYTADFKTCYLDLLCFIEEDKSILFDKFTLYSKEILNCFPTLMNEVEDILNSNVFRRTSHCFGDFEYFKQKSLGINKIVSLINSNHQNQYFLLQGTETARQVFPKRIVKRSTSVADPEKEFYNEFYRGDIERLGF